MHLAESVFVVALILYTWAIWSHRLGNHMFLRRKIVLIFGLALVADTWGTIFVCSIAAPAVVWNFHTITGFASLAIMALHFAWAFYAYKFAGLSQARYFSRYSIPAWSLWLASFISGLPWGTITAA